MYEQGRSRRGTATIMIVTALLIISALNTFLFAQKGDTPGIPFVITHVTLIDATGARPIPDATVVIVGDRIKEIGASQSVKAPKEAQRLDASGKFLIPGLWDMHAHISYKEFLALFIANGVTGVREMGGNPEEFVQLKEWRKQISNGTLTGPHIFAAGVIVDGPHTIGRRNSLNVENAIEARQAVYNLKQQGADFIKVYSMLPRDAYLAIADEAKKQGLSFAGHVPASITAVEASDAGQKSLEHLFGVFSACSKNAAALHNEANSAVAKSGLFVFVGVEIRTELKTLDTYDDKNAGALFARFVKNGTWQTPTLVGWQNLAATDETHFLNDPRLKYIPRERKDSWKVQKAALLKGFDPEYFPERQRLFEAQLRLIRAMHKAGIKLLAGTDTAGLYEYPGFSLHDELALLVRAGLTPMDALRCATRNPAEYFGLLDSFGTVEKGKIADLVLLDANPLEEIGNTRKIAAVVLGGKLISRSTLDEMLSGVEASVEAK